MPSVPGLPSATAISDTDLLWLTRGLGAGRDQQLPLSLLKTYAGADALAAVTAESAARVTAVTAEATARALIGTTQIYDANVTGNAYAKDGGGSGSDFAATTALLSISKITAKSWMLQVQMDFAIHTLVAGQPMRWTMHAASAGGGALIDNLLTALVAYGNHVPVPFGTWSWAYPGPIAESGFLMVSGVNPATVLEFTPKDTYLWGAQTGVATVGQMNLRASGMVILP